MEQNGPNSDAHIFKRDILTAWVGVFGVGPRNSSSHGRRRPYSENEVHAI